MKGQMVINTCRGLGWQGAPVKDWSYSTGDRLKEATKINLSSSALGSVISTLVDGKAKHSLS